MNQKVQAVVIATAVLVSPAVAAQITHAASIYTAVEQIGIGFGTDEEAIQQTVWQGKKTPAQSPQVETNAKCREFGITPTIDCKGPLA